MADEYSDFEGTELPADISYFKNCDDQNVQELLKLFKAVQDTIDFLMINVNIQDDDLGISVSEI